MTRLGSLVSVRPAEHRVTRLFTAAPLGIEPSIGFRPRDVLNRPRPAVAAGP